MRQPRSWRLHIGAHKTATTHLQDALAQRRAAVAAAGVDFIPRELFRAVSDFPPPDPRWPPARGFQRRRAFANALAQVRLGPETVAISEETLPGLTPEMLADPLYPRAERRLASFAALARREELQLFLSIRSFDEALPSAYAQALRAVPLPGGFAACMARAEARPPSWADYVERLLQLFSRAPLTVWTMEAYRADPRGVAALYLGVDPGPIEKGNAPASTRTPSSAAVAEAEARSTELPADLSDAERRRIIGGIYDRHAGNGPKFNPLTEPLRARLKARYADDLVRIAGMAPRVRLVHPGKDLA